MPKPSTFDVPLRCAVHDRDFAVSFRTNPYLPGKYFFDGIRKISGATGENDGADTKTVSASELPWDKAKCPYCSGGLFVHCSRCNAFVCLGRSNDKFFVCADSCGESGRTVSTDIAVSIHETAAEVEWQARRLLPERRGAPGSFSDTRRVTSAPRLTSRPRLLPGRKG